MEECSVGFRPLLRQHPAKERWLRCSIQIRFQPTEMVDQFRHVSNRKWGKFAESDDRNSHAWVCFQAEGEDRHHDKEDRHHGHNLKHKVYTNTISASLSVHHHRCSTIDASLSVHNHRYSTIGTALLLQHHQCINISASSLVWYHQCSTIGASPSVQHLWCKTHIHTVNVLVLLAWRIASPGCNCAWTNDYIGGIDIARIGHFLFKSDST